MNIISSSAYMKADNLITSSLETECLFGELVEIIEEHLDWVYCKLTTDNYYGWVKKKNLGILKKPTHRVISTRSFIYKVNNGKSDIALYLPMGSQLAIEKIKSGWAETKFTLDNMIKVGYVPSNHIVEIQNKVTDWVATAQKLEGTPYRWGGRDTVGLDCSALLQLSYQTYGQIIPRNTIDQVKLKKPNLKKISDLKRGCVVFWKGHVGIMVNNKDCIHANAFHMKTVTEPLNDIINRMGEDNQIIKVLNFND